MTLGPFEYYLIATTVVGFVLYAVNTWLYRHTEDVQIDAALTVASLLGGSLGIVLAMLIMDRKLVKDNMMSKLFVVCILVIQVVLVLLIKGVWQLSIDKTVATAFGEHSALLVYLAVINIVTFTVYGIDKRRAIEHGSRVRIVVLLGLAFAGGSVGALIAMYLFRHKTRKDYFTVGIPLIMLMHVVLAVFMVNAL